MATTEATPTEPGLQADSPSHTRYTCGDAVERVAPFAALAAAPAMPPRLRSHARQREAKRHAERRYPHKQAWMNKYLGILVFKLRPHPGQ